MKVNRSLPLSLLLILAISARVNFQTLAQEIVPPASHPPKPALQANVAGEVKPLKLTRSGFKASILAQPMPRVVLIFPSPGQNATKMTVQLPPDVRGILLESWRAELAYCYKKFFEVGNPQKRIDDVYTLGNVNAVVLSKLGTIEINTPLGRRKISEDEALAIVKFLAQSATDIMEQAKEYKRPKSLA